MKYKLPNFKYDDFEATELLYEELLKDLHKFSLTNEPPMEAEPFEEDEVQVILDLAHEINNTPDREYKYVAAVDLPEGEKSKDQKYEDFKETIGSSPNLVTSILPNGMHAPVIDIDIPCMLVPSSQHGHYHLYIDKEITWAQQVKLLDVLVELDIVEQGYRDAAVAKGYTAVRPVGVLKPDAPKGAETLKQIAELKQELYLTRRQLEALGEEEYMQRANEIVAEARAELLEMQIRLEEAEAKAAEAERQSNLQKNMSYY